MPKRTDIQSVLIIGAGPIIIGQACEFDYSGTQACKALKCVIVAAAGQQRRGGGAAGGTPLRLFSTAASAPRLAPSPYCPWLPPYPAPQG